SSANTAAKCAGRASTCRWTTRTTSTRKAISSSSSRRHVRSSASSYRVRNASASQTKRQEKRRIAISCFTTADDRTMSRETVEATGSVASHEEGRDGLTFAGSEVHVGISWSALVKQGEVYMRSNGMRDEGKWIVLDPHEAVILGTMLVEAGQR